MEQSENISELAAALVQAQADFPNMARDADGQMGNRTYKYTTLTSIVTKIREPLRENGLSFMQSEAADLESQSVICTTRLIHESGQWIETTSFVPHAEGCSNQDAGISQTYARRYGLCAALGIVSEDDTDGATGGGNKSAGGKTSSRGGKKSTEAQGKMFYVMRRKLDLSEDQVMQLLEKHGVDSFADLDVKQASGLLDWMKKKDEEDCPL